MHSNDNNDTRRAAWPSLCFLRAVLGLTLAALVLILVAPGCGGSSQGGNDSDGSGGRRVVLATGQFDVLRFTLRGKRIYARGENVALRFTVENTGPRAIEIVLGPPFADAQARQNGQVVWHWSANKIFPAVIETLRFAPGASRSYDLEWPAPAPGVYEVNAWFNGSHVQFVQPPDPPNDFNAGPAQITVR